MKKFNVLPLIALATLVGCSSTPKHYPKRSFASVDEMMSNPAKLKSKTDKLMSGIFHGYMMGQIYLYDFDKQLDKNPSKAMKSNAYSSLLSVRTHVDQFEHDINELYLNLVLATALPQYSDTQKHAQVSLDTIGKFFAGVKSDKKELPENLKPLILGNLREKMTDLYEELKALHDDPAVTYNDPAVKEVLRKNMVLLRATRLSYYKQLQTYQVDDVLLQATIKEEKNKQSYKDLEKQIQEMSKQMKEYTSELGRDTSADTIAPSAGPNGNISGKNFPEKTWSLTYDDGPAKTTPLVIKNLQDRKIPATFFMLAQQVKSNPNTAKLLKDGGFDLASHSYTHAQLTKVGPVQLEKEIGTAKEVIETQLDTKVKLFRLPYGAGVSVSNVRAKIATHKMIHVFWTVDTLDWQDKNPTTIYNRTLKQMNASTKNSGIILFHDIHSQSVTASTMLMDYFNKEKLTICTVQGVVDQLNNQAESCK